MNLNFKILIPLFCLAYAFSTSNAQYTIQDNDVSVENGTIIQCSTNATNWGTGDIIIPATLDGQAVTIVGVTAFSSKGITKLTLPEGVKELKAFAFSSNPISDIVLPSTLVKINGSVFEHCSLTQVTLPENLDYIGSSAFGYNSIHHVVIPRSVTYLGKSIFQHNYLSTVEFEDNSSIRLIDEKCFYDGGTSSLTSIILPHNSNAGFAGYKNLQNDSFDAGDVISDFTGVYYADLPPHILTAEDVQFTDNLISDYSGSYVNIIIPAEIGEIAIHTIPGASFDYRTLVMVKIDEGITSVGYNAFANDHIENLILPNSLSEIGSGAFMDNSLDSLILPDNVSSVAVCTFQNNTLKFVKISSRLTSIEANVFQGNLLDSITIPETVTSIGNYAFADNSMTHVNLHNDITTAGKFAFANNKIHSVNLSANLNSISQGLFENNLIDTVVIPANTRIIWDSAFSDNLLKGVLLPDKITYIGEKAFSRNPGLATVKLPEPVIKEGYTYINWIYIGDSSVVTSISDFDASYEAILSINTYDVIFTSGEHGKLAGDSIQVVEFGKDATEVYAIPESGYHFVKWQNIHSRDSVSAVNPIKIHSVTRDSSLVAIFAEDIASSNVGRSGFSAIVYPNPVNDFLYIRSPSLIHVVEIFSTNGLLIYHNGTVNNTYLSIDSKAFAPGTYFVKINGDDAYRVYQISKK